ncbi:MAG: magnesium transporter [Candidatus Hodarchaeota archaeon]
MEQKESKGKSKIIKETFTSEIISIIGDIFAGIILLMLILPFKSFLFLIIIVPALLSLRGNLSGPFIARTSRDFIIGEFNKKSLLENTLATFALSLVTGFLIGVFCIILNILIIKIFIFPIEIFILIPIISIIFTISISIPSSTTLNYIAFRYGFDPNNMVNPIMTAIDDFFTIVCFYMTLLILGVP